MSNMQAPTSDRKAGHWTTEQQNELFENYYKVSAVLT